MRWPGPPVFGLPHQSCAGNLHVANNPTTNSTAPKRDRVSEFVIRFMPSRSALFLADSLLRRDDGDLHARIVDERCGLDRRAHWLRIRQNGFVHFVHFWEILDIS